jgi:hypothetical protein
MKVLIENFLENHIKYIVGWKVEYINIVKFLGSRITSKHS